MGSVDAGLVKTGGGMTFVEVNGAGHMVPMNQPEAVRDNCSDFTGVYTHARSTASCYSHLVITE